MSSALVIGAGLAGAASCVALARRGWQLTLLDAAEGPSQGASALPVGMLSPHVTRAPTPLSRLCALGMSDMWAQLELLGPPGRGWQPCEVDNLGHDPGRWPAALVRPAALVDAWLDECRRLTTLTTHWHSPVDRLVNRSTQDQPWWQALDAEGQVLAEASVVVIAAAFGTHALLAREDGLMAPEALPLRPVKGQMSLAALQGDPLAERPQRNNGVFVPVYEDAGLPPQWPPRIWAMGSTYERGDNTSHVNDAAHERNAHSLETISPAAAQRQRETAARGDLLGWAQVRCASLDRVPLVGAVPHLPKLHEHMVQAGARRGRVPMTDTPRWPGLFMLSALGSRGLTLAHAMGELLARLIVGEDANLEADLLRALDPARFAWKQARRQPA
jgi:tRNA 5-methylaminomethyl-2-thiouridine biosynthesis bifunctional protein